MSTPLFRFACLSDVQYADKDDTFLEDRQQRYREAPQKLQQAVDAYSQERDQLSFLLHCGDIIDGNDSTETTMADLETILAIFRKLVRTVKANRKDITQRYASPLSNCHNTTSLATTALLRAVNRCCQP